MFLKTKLQTLDLSKWNTSSVTTTNSMFSESPLKQLNVSNWNVENVMDMSHMFLETKLNELDLSGWKCGRIVIAPMMLAYSPINILKVSDSVSLQGAGLAPVIDKTHHSTHVDPDKQVIPDKWLEVGNGTIDKPKVQKNSLHQISKKFTPETRKRPQPMSDRSKV
jgi:surface protein